LPIEKNRIEKRGQRIEENLDLACGGGDGVYLFISDT